MKTYTVRPRRRDGGWDLDVEDVGLLRTARLTGAEKAVRDHLDVLGFGDARTAHLTYEYAADVKRAVSGVRDARSAADAANRLAADRARELAARLAGEGYAGAEIAVVLEVTPQRVSQLLAVPDPVAEALPVIDLRTTAAKAPKKRKKKDKAAKKKSAKA